MNFNLVEMYNGLLRFNKHILNELAEGLKHNSLFSDVNSNLKPKVNSIDSRVTALENSSQS